MNKFPESNIVYSQLINKLFVSSGYIDIDSLKVFIYSLNGIDIAPPSCYDVSYIKDFAENNIITDLNGLMLIDQKKLREIASKSQNSNYSFTCEFRKNIIFKYSLCLLPSGNDSVLYFTVSQLHASDNSISLMYNKSQITFKYSDIIYIGYGNHCVEIYTENGVTKFFSIIFNDIAAKVLELPNFIRSYKNCIVNMDRVSHISKDTFVMDNGDVISIPKRKVREIKNIYFEYSNIRKE